MTFSTKLTWGQILAVLGLILAVALYRGLAPFLLPGLPNFSPVMALALCSGLFLPGIAALIVPVAAILISDVVLALAKGYPVVGSWQVVSFLCLLAAVGAGRWLGRRETFGLGAYVGLLLAGGIGFYLVSNTAAWVIEPAYPRSLAGYVQAQTVGLPGLPPSWMFLRNALISDLIFGGLVLAVRLAARRSTGEFAEPLHIEVRH